jgi:Protein of unknown function (DUF2924)
MRPDHDGTLEAEIARLNDLGLDDLRKFCGRLVGAVPANHGTHLLRRRLAYELQAKALGDLPTETQRRLKRLHEAFKADPGFTPLPGLGLKPGTVLTRTWHGVLHRGACQSAIGRTALTRLSTLTALTPQGVEKAAAVIHGKGILPLTLIRDRPQKAALRPGQVCDFHDHFRPDPMHF